MRRTLVIPASLALTLAAITDAAGQTARGNGQGLGRLGTGDTDALAGFSVVLVMGSTTTGSPGPTTPGIPGPAAKAIADLKDFLPYRSYTLIDSQWAIGSRGFTTTLQGPQGATYSVSLSARLVSPTQINVGSFSLTDARAAVHQGQSESAAVAGEHQRQLESQIQHLTAQLDSLRAKNLEGTKQAEELKQRLASLGREQQFQQYMTAARASPPSSNRAVISTSFSMDVGETVVVGTSRVDGDRALIVLLTAVPKKPGSASQ